jgi:hypothetical protein
MWRNRRAPCAWGVASGRQPRRTRSPATLGQRAAPRHLQAFRSRCRDGTSCSSPRRGRRPAVDWRRPGQGHGRDMDAQCECHRQADFPKLAPSLVRGVASKNKQTQISTQVVRAFTVSPGTNRGACSQSEILLSSSVCACCGTCICSPFCICPVCLLRGDELNHTNRLEFLLVEALHDQGGGGDRRCRGRRWHCRQRRHRNCRRRRCLRHTTTATTPGCARSKSRGSAGTGAGMGFRCGYRVDNVL